jgi:arylsulfatase A-like enzyme
MLSVRSICIPLASVALLLACTEASEPARGPNVVLVTIDTLRADSLGAYGARTPRTPHVDRLAREGTLWENATSSIPATKPSHFSLLSSRYPRDHGVLNNEGVLPDDVLSVVEVFQRAGWSTAGFVASSLLDSSSGAARGFDLLDAPRRPTRDADRVVPRATRWLEEVALSEPFFLWIHLFDPHIPYAPPPEHVPAEAASGSNGLARVGWKSLASIAEAHAGDLPREVLERALALYAGEVAHVDHWMGVLLDALERRELLDQTALLFTADHGECFENGIYFFHSNCLYEAAVRVPLILRYPRAVESGLRRPEVVENRTWRRRCCAWRASRCPRSSTVATCSRRDRPRPSAPSRSTRSTRPERCDVAALDSRRCAPWRESRCVRWWSASRRWPCVRASGS